jgi:RNA polymerase sigma-70 factor (ECF subfamily)
MQVNDARREARFEDGEMILLGDQDRSLWNGEQIGRAKAEVDRAIALGGRGNYVLQAAVAVLHTEDPPDWDQIAAIYEQLARLTGSPVVELNRAAAIGEAGDPEAGLELIEKLDLDAYSYLHSTRGALLWRLGRSEEARVAYERALELIHSEPERRFLERRLAELEG